MQKNDCKIVSLKSVNTFYFHRFKTTKLSGHISSIIAPEIWNVLLTIFISSNI